jgi:hypothetical protein
LLDRVGTANVVVSNPGPGGGDSLVEVFSITNAPLTVLLVHLNVFGNKTFTGPVATFTDGNPTTTAADFKAIITWDNGKSDYGTITGADGTTTGAGPFTVSGTHTFGAFQNLRTVTVTILDRDGYAVEVIDNVIDPPAPTPPQKTRMNKVLILSGARRISIADLGPADRSVRVVLTVTHGTLTLRTAAGPIRISGNGTARVRLTGSVQKINNALAGLRYQPTTGFRGQAKLTILTQALGDTGFGGPTSATGTVSITVA